MKHGAIERPTNGMPKVFRTRPQRFRLAQRKIQRSRLVMAQLAVGIVFLMVSPPRSRELGSRKTESNVQLCVYGVDLGREEPQQAQRNIRRIFFLGGLGAGGC